MKTIVTANAPQAIGPYSQAVQAGGLMFCSGQIALDPATGDFLNGNIRQQTERVLNNVQALLEAGGCTLQNVVKTTCFLADMGDFAAFNEVYARYFTQKPARSCVAAKELPKGALVEVEVIAVLP
ncbi:RidA family protein [Clostridia bacterium OttesenSCG-928-F22]|nr:RidA family protein [Clostridia bacterium OttesenSCG-928-F22]